MDEPKEGATTLKKKAQEKLAAKANPVEETPVAEVSEPVAETVVETPTAEEAIVETPAVSEPVADIAVSEVPAVSEPETDNALSEVPEEVTTTDAVVETEVVSETAEAAAE
jgi:small subunit ribosomal protein S16